MIKLRIAIILVVSLISCGKVIDNKPISGKQLKTVSVVTTPTDPPVSIINDLTATSPGGANVIVITAAEYNDLDALNQIYYSGLKNAIEYLYQTSTTQASMLQFNADGSYKIIIDGDSFDNGPNSSDSCVICGATSAYNCKGKINSFLNTHGGVMNPRITKVKVGSDSCMKIVFQPSPTHGDQPVDYGGTVVETYTPAPTGPIITFPYSEFDLYIQTVKNWAANYQGGSIPVSNPNGWTRQDLIYHLRVFINDTTHPIYDHQNDADFQTQLEYYVNNILGPV